MSFDAGMNGNLFGGHYFDLNKDHVAGNLKKVEMDGAKRWSEDKYTKLVIRARNSSEENGERSGSSRLDRYVEGIRSFVRWFKNN